MKYLIFIMSFITLNACAAASGGCKNLPTQFEMTSCSVEKLEKLEKVIEEKTKHLSDVIAEDKEIGLVNKIWVKYRDAHCASVSKIYLGGSVYNYVLTECKIHQSQIRLKALEDDYKDIINIITTGAP